MKKFMLLGGVAALVLSAAVYFANTTRTTNDLLAANIKALTAGESGAGAACWDTVTQADAQQTFYCGTCSFISGKPSTFAQMGRCSK